MQITGLNEYQEQALKTADYPDIGRNLIYPALGLVGEAGEVADKIKKFWRNQEITDAADLSPDDEFALVKDMGDVLWYLAALAEEIGIGLEEVAQTNLEKLWDRKKRGVIKAEGDNR